MKAAKLGTPGTVPATLWVVVEHRTISVKQLLSKSNAKTYCSCRSIPTG